jgi:hypothetical protein
MSRSRSIQNSIRRAYIYGKAGFEFATSVDLVDFDDAKGMTVEVDLVTVYTGKRAQRC